MRDYDLSFDASGQVYKGGVKRKTLPQKGIAVSFWVDMIVDLVEGAGYSYSRIAYSIRVSPSTIQKLVAHPDRCPSPWVFNRLFKLHNKVFYGQYATPKVKKYLMEKYAQ